MNYLLVQNQTTVILGPMPWKQRFIQSEITQLIEDGVLSVNFTVPATEQGYINIGDGFEIFPCIVNTPDIDYNYQYLIGPTWSYTGNIATGSYTVGNTDISIVKSNLKNIVATERYSKQNQGTTVTVANTTFFVDTDTNTLNQFVSLANATGTNTINYKSPVGFISVTGADIQSIVDQINAHIQEQFNWEMTMGQTIDAASDVTALQLIKITG
jgi:hypothetical protein